MGQQATCMYCNSCEVLRDEFEPGFDKDALQAWTASMLAHAEESYPLPELDELETGAPKPTAALAGRSSVGLLRGPAGGAPGGAAGGAAGGATTAGPVELEGERRTDGLVDPALSESRLFSQHAAPAAVVKSMGPGRRDTPRPGGGLTLSATMPRRRRRQPMGALPSLLESVPEPLDGFGDAKAPWVRQHDYPTEFSPDASPEASPLTSASPTSSDPDASPELFPESSSETTVGTASMVDFKDFASALKPLRTGDRFRPGLREQGVGSGGGHMESQAARRFLDSHSFGGVNEVQFAGADGSKYSFPLHRAVKVRDAEAVRALLRSAADAGVTDSKGRTPLQYAKDKDMYSSHRAVLQALAQGLRA